MPSSGLVGGRAAHVCVVARRGRPRLGRLLTNSALLVPTGRVGGTRAEVGLVSMHVFLRFSGSAFLLRYGRREKLKSRVTGPPSLRVTGEGPFFRLRTFGFVLYFLNLIYVMNQTQEVEIHLKIY